MLILWCLHVPHVQPRHLHINHVSLWRNIVVMSGERTFLFVFQLTSLVDLTTTTLDIRSLSRHPIRCKWVPGEAPLTVKYPWPAKEDTLTSTLTGQWWCSHYPECTTKSCKLLFFLSYPKLPIYVFVTGILKFMSPKKCKFDVTHLSKTVRRNCFKLTAMLFNHSTLVEGIIESRP